MESRPNEETGEPIRPSDILRRVLVQAYEGNAIERTQARFGLQPQGLRLAPHYLQPNQPVRMARNEPILLRGGSYEPPKPETGLYGLYNQPHLPEPSDPTAESREATQSTQSEDHNMDDSDDNQYEFDNDPMEEEEEEIPPTPPVAHLNADLRQQYAEGAWHVEQGYQQSTRGAAIPATLPGATAQPRPGQYIRPQFPPDIPPARPWHYGQPQDQGSMKDRRRSQAISPGRPHPPQPYQAQQQPVGAQGYGRAPMGRGGPPQISPGRPHPPQPYQAQQQPVGAQGYGRAPMGRGGPPQISPGRPHPPQPYQAQQQPVGAQGYGRAPMGRGGPPQISPGRPHPPQPYQAQQQPVGPQGYGRAPMGRGGPPQISPGRPHPPEVHPPLVNQDYDWLYDLRTPDEAVDDGYKVPPPPAWTRTRPETPPSSQSSSGNTPPRHVIYKWIARLLALVAAAPSLRQGTTEEMRAWSVWSLWDREALHSGSLYLTLLDDWVVAHAEQVCKKTGQTSIRPKDYKMNMDKNKFVALMKDEITSMYLHALEDPDDRILRCTEPQDIIDEIARNRVWDLPWYGSWQNDAEKRFVKYNVMRRGRWLGRYFRLVQSKRVEFFPEVRGAVLEESQFLLSWHMFQEFDDPLAERTAIAHLIDWSKIIANMSRERNEADMKELWNYDRYSTLFIEGALAACYEDKPSVGTGDMHRVGHWFEGVGDGPHALNWLIYSDQFQWPIDLQLVPRAIMNQVVYGRLPGQLTRAQLLESRDPLPRNELDYRFLQHTRLEREHLDSLLADIEDDTTTEEESGSENRGPLRCRRSKHIARYPSHLLRCEYWALRTFTLDNLPSLQTLKDLGEYRISDHRLPDDIMCCFANDCYGNISMKDYDPEGDSTKDLDPQEVDAVLTKYLLHNATDFPGAPPAEVKPGIDWKEKMLKNAGAYKGVTKIVWKTKKPPRPKKMRTRQIKTLPPAKRDNRWEGNQGVIGVIRDRYTTPQRQSAQSCCISKQDEGIGICDVHVRASDVKVHTPVNPAINTQPTESATQAFRGPSVHRQPLGRPVPDEFAAVLERRQAQVQQVHKAEQEEREREAELAKQFTLVIIGKEETFTFPSAKGQLASSGLTTRINEWPDAALQRDYKRRMEWSSDSEKETAQMEKMQETKVNEPKNKHEHKDKYAHKDKPKPKANLTAKPSKDTSNEVVEISSDSSTDDRVSDRPASRSSSVSLGGPPKPKRVTRNVGGRTAAWPNERSFGEVKDLYDRVLLLKDAGIDRKTAIQEICNLTIPQSTWQQNTSLFSKASKSLLQSFSHYSDRPWSDFRTLHCEEMKEKEQKPRKKQKKQS
ncbi:hypothetical protein CALCODRAFT_513145 [Calocera cornea HHB12733]|uniref:Uncharacterized protein n=1 Tax=Calocera cornea HHB12733 TaxID=1353952 RepID=A0A165CFA3_9BASI|nr:hypothetical protein CALCODRAFT_513145 [Calocera cornea HHB12733]